MTTELSGFIDLFQAENPEGNRPHFKGFLKINGQKLEFACWPAKSGKPGVYSGKVTPERQQHQPSAQGYHQPQPYQPPASPAAYHPPQAEASGDDSW